MLALEYEDAINPTVLVKLDELVKQGAVIVGEKPKEISQIVNTPLTQEGGEKLIDQLWTNSADPGGKIFSGVTPLEMVSKLNVAPDFDYVDKESFLLDFIHYEKDDLDFYFVANTSGEWVSRECSFRVKSKLPEIWDPVSGKIIPVAIYEQDQQYTTIPLTLAPYGSQLIAFSKASPTSHYDRIAGDNQHPPLLEFTRDGFQLLEEGSFEISHENQSKVITSSIQKKALEGEWELSFPDNWGAPAKVELPDLISWTESEIEGIRYFSGTATYEKEFQFEIESNANDNQRIYLNLGELSKVGEVWLNGQHVGITWSKPHKFDVTHILKSGKNHLVIEVANTWSNRLTGDANTGEHFTNTNIVNTVLPVEGMLPGARTRVPWADVPLIESGLLGPVTLEFLVSRTVD
jgi:hypothetical protein